LLDDNFAGETVTGADGTYVLHDSLLRDPGWYSVYAEADGYDGYDIWVEWDGETPVVAEFELDPIIGPSTIDLQHDAAGVVFDRWVTGYSTAYSGDGYVYGRWTGTELEATFTGSKVRWVGPKQPSYGMADVYIDDVLVAQDVDCYAPAGSATLEVAHLGEWHACRRPAYAEHPPHRRQERPLDRQRRSYRPLRGRRSRACKGLGTRIDDTAASPGYAGAWIQLINPTYYNKTYAYSRWAAHSFTATFTGTRCGLDRSPHHQLRHGRHLHR
jgi:hypothetical protein